MYFPVTDGQERVKLRSQYYKIQRNQLLPQSRLYKSWWQAKQGERGVSTEFFNSAFYQKYADFTYYERGEET